MYNWICTQILALLPTSRTASITLNSVWFIVWSRGIRCAYWDHEEKKVFLTHSFVDKVWEYPKFKWSKKKRILISKIVMVGCCKLSLYANETCDEHAIYEMTCHVNHFFDIWQWCNFSGIEALKFSCIYYTRIACYPALATGYFGRR